MDKMSNICKEPSAQDLAYGSLNIVLKTWCQTLDVAVTDGCSEQCLLYGAQKMFKREQ